MIRRPRNRAAVALFAWVLLWVPPRARGDGSGLFNWLFSDLNLVSVEQEAEISRELARDVESKQPIVRDREVEEYVSDLGERLVAVLRRPDFRYRFLVVDDRTVNAFGIGGGHIYVNSGLLAAADTEGQVAAVLAHEIGHQVRRHVAKQMSRQAVFEGLARVAVGPHASQWINLAAGLGVTSGQLYFGREAERDADSVMVDLLPRAGYDPHEALAIFAKLRAIEGRDPGAVATLLSSHPPTRERIEMIEQAIARQRPAHSLIRDSRRFQEVHRRVLTELPGRARGLKKRPRFP